MISDKQRSEYLKHRAIGIPAHLAYYYAMLPDPPELEWSEASNGFRASLERDGFNLTIAAKYDYDCWDMGTVFQSDYNDCAVQHPEWDAFMSVTDGRGDDRNYGYHTPDVYRWIVLDFSYAENRDYYSQHGYSRGVADFKAREDVRRARDFALRDDRIVFWLDVRAFRNGIELGRDTLGGCELDPDADYDEMLIDLSQIVDDHGMIETAITEAREALSGLVESA